jgi:hypothetical protein
MEKNVWRYKILPLLNPFDLLSASHTCQCLHKWATDSYPLADFVRLLNLITGIEPLPEYLPHSLALQLRFVLYPYSWKYQRYWNNKEATCSIGGTVSEHVNISQMIQIGRKVGYPLS